MTTASESAKERLTIPELWRLLNLPGNPGRSCRSPFREDRNPSFSVYDGAVEGGKTMQPAKAALTLLQRTCARASHRSPVVMATSARR